MRANRPRELFGATEWVNYHCSTDRYCSHSKTLVYPVRSVIEYLDYDLWSRHDTFDQKVLLRVISARVKDPQVDFLVFKCVMSRPLVIIKVLYDTRIDQKIQRGDSEKKSEKS